MSKNSYYHTGCINGKKTQITDPATGETRTPYARVLIRRRQIRSVKAKEYIEAGCKRADRPSGVETLLRQDAEVAVVSAEDNARERAAKAFCSICGDPCNASKEDRELCAGCDSDLWRFLKHYDNEQ